MLHTNHTELTDALRALGKGPYTTEEIEAKILEQRAAKAKPKKRKKK